MRSELSFSVLFCLIITTLTTSCSKKNANDNPIDEISVAESRFILLPDADTIRESWSKENIIVNHWPADPDNIHPTNGKSTARSWIISLTSNYLLRNDPVNLSITPDIAAAFPDTSADRLQFTYTLRQDAKWDDGSPITSEDVIFTIKAIACPLVNNPFAKPYVENVKDIVSEGVYKLTIIMKKEYFLNVAFVADFPIMQRSYHDKNNVLSKYTFEQFSDPAFTGDQFSDLTGWANEFNDAKYGTDLSLLNGSGAYEVESWTTGQSIILQKKKNHWTQQIKSPNVYLTSYPEKIIFKIVRDPNTQKLELLSQDIDVSVWLSSETTMELMKDPEFVKNYNVKFADRYDYNYIGMNMRPDGTKHKKFFDDKRVRRAMAYLIPVDNLIQTIANGYAQRQASCVSPLKKEYNTDLQLIPYNVEEAKKLLDEAGWKDTDGDNIRDKVIDGSKTAFSFEFKYQAGLKFADDMTKVIKESMYLAGIDFIPISYDPNVLGEFLANHDFDMYMSAWGGGAAPEDFGQLFSTKAYEIGGSNFVGFGNAASDILIDSIKYTMEEDKRTVLVKQFQQMVYDEQPYVFLYASSRKIIVHKRFGNQYMTFDRPGVLLNNLRLLSLYGLQ